MLSGRAHMALIDLDGGARLNSVHSVARELIAHEAAIDNFGFLEITEFGRKVARAKFRDSLVISDDNVADLSYRVDPMSNPDAMSAPAPPPPAWVELPTAPEPAPVALDPTSDETVRAYRAAGVATGKTGIEVEARWVIAFVEAWGTL